MSEPGQAAQPDGSRTSNPIPEHSASVTDGLGTAGQGVDGSVADIYGDRLNAIWYAVHGSWPEPESPVFRLVRDSTLSTGILAEIGNRGLRSNRGQPLSGDAATVNLQVTQMLSELPPDRIAEFGRTRLASTIRRLESEGVSREDVTDIVIRFLRSLPVTPGTTSLAGRLLGYLAGETRRRSSGHHLSVAMSADLIARANDRTARIAASIGYTAVVSGMWELIRAEQPESFTGQYRQITSNNLTLLAGQVMAFLPRGSTYDSEPRAGQMARRLMDLAAVVTDGPGVRADAARVLGRIGLTSSAVLDDPAGACAVIRTLAREQDQWGGQTRSIVVESVAGVAEALARQSNNIPRAMFNGGVAVLKRADLSPLRSTRARLVLNAVGLIWGMTLDPVAREESGALECVVNFAGAANELFTADGDSELWPAVGAAVKAAVAVPGVMETPTRAARIQQSLRVLRLPPMPIDEAQTTPRLVDAVVSVLRSDGGPVETWHRPDLQENDLIDATAETVGWVLHWLSIPISAFSAEVVSILGERQRGRQVFLDRWAPRTRALTDDPEQAVLVEAGLIDPEEWGQAVRSLLADTASLAPHLATFSG